MNSLQLLASVTAGAGLLIFALAIPLILRRVPPNELYGVRTKAAFASEADWYRINAIGGRYLAISGVLIFLTGCAGFFLPVSMRNTYSVASAIITLFAVLVPCIRLCRLKPLQSSSDEGERV
jgi:uncharacterized membrane protein